MELKNILNSGLWPFTPDPIASGVYKYGTPPNNPPILLTSNSHHTLSQLRQVLSHVGGIVLAVDTGGMDIHSALASGNWSLDKIASALNAIDQEKSSASPGEPESAEPIKSREKNIFILPFSVWEALRGDRDREIQGFYLIPGPENARDLPDFFARGCKLTEEMKILKYSFRDRLELSLAQVGIYSLGVVLPMLAFGWQEVLAGVGIALISAVAFTVIFPYLPAKNFWLKRVPIMIGLPALGGFLGWIFGLNPLALLNLGLVTFIGTGWITINIHLQ